MSPGGFGTPQQSQERKSRSRTQSIIPCTIAQILNTTQEEDNKFFSGETEISQVTIVGLVRSVKESSTRIDYEIDDMSGPLLEVKQFVDNDENVPDEERVQAMRENTYVRAYGHVRAFQGKHSVVAFKLMPLTDMNELSCHLLEVVHAHMVLSQQGASGGASTSAFPTPGGAMNMDTSGGLTGTQQQVHTLIKNNFTEEGANIVSICQQLKGVSEKAIRDAIEFLSSEGHIYSTIDEDHFKATDS
ncbi:replication protein A 32 kDa subunit-A-like isoform X2 [Liolophura sinensis]